MDARQFLAEFGHIANAPGGVAQLRQMIYQLAITGTLTPQTLADGNARALLAEIGALRNELVRDKRYKRLPKLEAQALSVPTEIDLPASWCWTRLLDIGEISPRNEADDQAPASFIPMSGIPQLHQRALFTEVARWGDIKKGFTHFANGDVVVAKITPCFENGKAASITGLKHQIGAGTTELHVFRPIHAGVMSRYVFLFLRSPYFAIEGEKSMTGTAGQKRLPTDYFATRAFPLPPTEEQARIVAKVDELMALCDQLEAQQQQRRRLQTNLRQSTLQAVAAASSPYELQTTWARLADNFGQLFVAAADVKALREVIFELAMRGVLLPNATLDACESEGELPGLPNGWIWQTLGELSEYITSGSRGWKDYISIAGDAFIRSQDIKQDALVFENPAFVALPEKAEGKRTLVKEGDLLLTITGGNVGKCAAVPPQEGKAYVSQHVALIRLNDRSLAEFIHYWMINSHGGRGFLARYIYGDKPGLNLGQVASVPVPIPLESDRVRILESLRLYQSMCDRLTLQVEAKHKLAAMLSFATTASITGIDATPEEETPLRAPQTELIAPLRLGQAPDIKKQAPLATILARHQGELAAKDLWQRFGGEIDAFYAQLKQEVAHGWIQQPEVAEMREKAAG